MSLSQSLKQVAGRVPESAEFAFFSFTSQNSPKQGRRAEISAGFHFFGGLSAPLEQEARCLEQERDYGSKRGGCRRNHPIMMMMIIIMAAPPGYS
jgi:hypothetical protein